MLIRSIIATAFLAGGLLAPAACVPSDECGSDLEYRDRACQKPLPADAAAPVTTPPPISSNEDAQGPVRPAQTEDAQGPAQPDPSIAFGTACTTATATTACTGVATFCTANPYQPTGYCTAQDCDKTPTVCPTGWTCKQMFTSPFFCMKL
jgi:hypothetical protein